MPEDAFYLALEFADKGERERVQALLCGQGPAYREEIPEALVALFEVTEREPIAGQLERVGDGGLQAEWEMWPNSSHTAQEMCEACGTAGARSVWALYCYDGGYEVWRLAHGQLDTVYARAFDDGEEEEYEGLEGIVLLDAVRMSLRGDAESAES